MLYKYRPPWALSPCFRRWDLKIVLFVLFRVDKLNYKTFQGRHTDRKFVDYCVLHIPASIALGQYFLTFKEPRNRFRQPM
jgi:hypothetical protein